MANQETLNFIRAKSFVSPLSPEDIEVLFKHIDTIEELLDISEQHGVISPDGATWRERE